MLTLTKYCKQKRSNESGFINRHSLFNLFILGICGVLLYYVTNWGREFYTIKVCEDCTRRMEIIEKAKDKFRKDHPGGKPELYADLLPYIQFSGFPLCPWGGKYEHELDLTKKVTCSLNGDPAYTPIVPGVDPRKNGYMNLEVKIKPIGLFEFIENKILGKPLQQGTLNKKQIEVKRLFED